MKAIILILGLIGFTSIYSYSQNKSTTNANTTGNTNCICKKKIVHHRATARKITGKVVVKKAKKPLLNNYYSQTGSLKYVAPPKGCAVDSDGEITYINSNSYTGYYNNTITDCDINDNMATPFSDLKVTSSAFKNNGVLPAKYACSGEQVNPPLTVTNIPSGTVSLAVIMFDPHATYDKSGTNWIIWNLDTSGVIPEGFATDHESESPKTKQYGYQGVCPLDGNHYYHIRVYALDTKLLLDRHTTRALLESTIQGHVLSKGELICQYNKHLD